MKFLVVDDEPNILETIAFFIECTGHSVKTCTHPGQALMLEERFDTIISDYKMPSMNGYDFLEQSQRKWPHSVRVLMSGYRKPLEEMQEKKRKIVHKTYAKPFTIEEMLGEVIHYVQSEQKHEQL